MKNQLNTIFKKIDFPSPSSGLGEKVLLQIQMLEERRRRRMFRITSIGRTLSLVAFVSAGFSFGQTVIASDFWQLISLFISDTGIVIRYFNEFLISLLETMPAFSLTLILMPLFSFLLFQYWSLRIRDPHRFTPGTMTFQTA